MPYTPPETPEEVKFMICYCEVVYQGVSGVETEYIPLANGFMPYGTNSSHIQEEANAAYNYISSGPDHLYVSSTDSYVPRSAWLQISQMKTIIRTYDISSVTPTVTGP